MSLQSGRGVARDRAGDFDGDGKSDILWQNTTARRGLADDGTSVKAAPMSVSIPAPTGT